MELSKSLEDYLETVYNLADKVNGTQVKDIADYMQVSMPAVTTAMKHLHEKDLVTYKAYEPIKLTPAGTKLAKSIVNRHLTIKTFLTDVLKLDNVTAHKEACILEHSMESATIKKLAILIDKVKQDPHFKELVKEEKALTLGDLKPGTSAVIKSVNGEKALKHRIIEMGLTIGTKITVVRIAPLGDPIEIKIRGFLLSLRQSEAKNIIVNI